ncbi:glycosyltransferase family 4 protein [Micrococcus luteus]|uniref:glycosyltransferase family 4 protein n=1 Tax=Micrococcus luteus TaxID=1270 RepID=UPI0015D8E902|nr:glycosyltransferase family 4 protein [Micrococcus luteus]
MTGRIWILANQGEVGGGEVMLHHLATALRELGRDVGVVAPAHPAETADRLDADGFTVERVGGPGRAGYMRALRRWHRAHRDDVVWCNGLLPATALAGRGRRIVHLHQWLAGARNVLLGRVATRGALAVLVPSRSVAASLPGSRVLSNWVPQPVPSASAGRAATGPFRVGYLGRFSFDKGFELYLDVAEELTTAEPGAWRFSAAGAPRFTTEEEAEGIRERLAETSAVASVGWQEPGNYLPTLHLLVVPSLAPESFGLVAAEAMAAGVPVAVSDSGALPEVAGEDHPLEFASDDHDALVGALCRAREVDLEALARAQRERWQEHFSPEAGRAAVARLLEDLHI